MGDKRKMSDLEVVNKAKNKAIRRAEIAEKRIVELEQKISVLLSCKKCPENKGGYICQKEYENKCLAQKIEFIKELQKENTKLKTDYEVLSCSVGNFDELQNKLEEEQRENNALSDNLTKAKELLAKWVELYKPKSKTALPTPIQVVTEQFINSEVEK